jgi:tetratricopeptide (TPR) repeat protein
MATKKKTSGSKSVVEIKEVPRNILHDGTMVRPGVPGAPRNPSEEQLKGFDQAMKLFRAQNYREARQLFEGAIDGPQKEVSHNARLHVIMCDRRVVRPELELTTLDDHYNYAIERLNSRDLENARKHLQEALSLHERDGAHPADHVYYALAACAGLGGDARTAYENLKRAIEIDPRNRVAARQDNDFSSIAQQPGIQQLLYPERA